MEIDYDKFWEEVRIKVREQFRTEFRKPYEKTISELQREWKTTDEEAKRLVSILVENKTLGCRQAKCANGKVVTVYFAPDNK